MQIILSIIVLIVGFIMAIKPDIWWKITESWKSYSASDTSDFYLKLTRFGGFFFWRQEF